MKNEIKLLITLIAASFLCFGCSNESTDTDTNENVGNDSGDNTGGDNTGGNDTSTYKFIRSIRELNAPDYNTGAQFIYEDEKLVFVHLYECSGRSYAFEYNSEGKISKRYIGTVDNFNIDSFDLTEFKANADIVVNYLYDNSVLTDIQSEEGFIYYHFSYDSNERLQVLEWFTPEITFLWQKNTLSYNSDGSLDVLNKKEYSTDGTLNRDNDYTFEFDNNTNPFVAFNESFGLYTFYSCQGIDYISSMDTGLKIFQNNPTAVYKDGELLFSSTYEYDSDGYPTRMSYTNFNGNYSKIELIEY